ncbi:helix-turn-helix domain-containing protein [Anaeromicropila herbilytica]|uniref:HTH merR-type domain-containing protein n=1 Tax=Anaeromicropila herbilytica TaxID=2785025 RepID=A0A7R7IBP2_9FIRM|nr:MerR family transcriptional regulator [Anaeromicropila herbilytica]BCN29853.1 hypothetical protein bsdtb5_11480 [Anaeromicropila herbilytica]
MSDTFIPISAVCKKLHTTSRTLRFYEEKGLIISDRITEHAPRRYRESEVVKIHKILLLRSLDLSLTDIKELLDEKDILQALKKRKRQLVHQIEKDTELINRLESVDHTSFQSHITDTNENSTIASINSDEELKQIQEMKEISYQMTTHLINKEYNSVISLFAEELRGYLSIDFFKSMWESTLIESGEVINILEAVPSKDYIASVLIHCSITDLLLKYQLDQNFYFITIAINTIEL